MLINVHHCPASEIITAVVKSVLCCHGGKSCVLLCLVVSKVIQNTFRVHYSSDCVRESRLLKLPKSDSVLPCTKFLSL